MNDHTDLYVIKDMKKRVGTIISVSTNEKYKIRLRKIVQDYGSPGWEWKRVDGSILYSIREGASLQCGI